MHAELTELKTKNDASQDRQLLLDATNAKQLKHLNRLEKELKNATRDSSFKEQNFKLDVAYKDK